MARTGHTALNDDFAYEVLSVVEEIPEGCVATYGQIAQLIGHPRNSRLVARVLARSHYYGEFPTGSSTTPGVWPPAGPNRHSCCGRRG